MPIKVLNDPVEIHTTKTPHGEAVVFRYVEREGSYAKSFGYEWNKYSKTYIDSSNDVNFSKKRLELNLGFPVEFLRGMNVLEIGSGAGRFTEHLVKYAQNVVTVDLSSAIFSNIALGSNNLTAIQADLTNLPPLSQPIDLVFCRGVIQHTPDPQKSIQKLFDYVKPGGLAIFDVYRKTGSEWRNFKYFWRPILQGLFTIEKFDQFLDRRGETLYGLHHKILKIINRFGFVKRIISKTPLYLKMDWNWQYPQLGVNARREIFKNELIDMFYAQYDNPLNFGEVVSALSEIGQAPYSYDIERNHYRCKFSGRKLPIKVIVTKNGIVEV